MNQVARQGAVDRDVTAFIPDVVDTYTCQWWRPVHLRMTPEAYWRTQGRTFIQMVVVSPGRGHGAAQWCSW